MSRRWAALLLVVALSGCMEAQDNKGTEADPDKTTSSTATDHPVIFLEDCENLILSTRVPAAWAEPFVPAGFEIYFKETGLALVQIDMIDCSRAVKNGTIEGAVRLLEASIMVGKKVDAGESAFPYLVFESFSDSELLIDAFDGQNVSVRPARFDLELDEMVSGVVSNHWTLSGEGFEYALQFLNRTTESDTMSERFETWYPVSPLTMAIREGNHSEPTWWLTDAALLTLNGDSDLGRLFQGQGRWSFDILVRWNGYHTLTVMGGLIT